MSVEIPIRCKRPRVFLAGIVLLAGVVFNLNEAFPQTPGKIKIGLPDFSISFLSVKIAQSQGLFVSEGLDAELIRISNPVAMIALLNKEIDYAASTGSVLASAVRGLPLRVIMYSLRTPFHALLVKPENQSSSGDQRKGHRCRHRNHRGDSSCHDGSCGVDRERRQNFAHQRK